MPISSQKASTRGDKMDGSVQVRRKLNKPSSENASVENVSTPETLSGEHRNFDFTQRATVCFFPYIFYQTSVIRPKLIGRLLVGRGFGRPTGRSFEPAMVNLTTL